MSIKSVLGIAAAFFGVGFGSSDHPHESPLSITQEIKDRCIEKARVKREVRQKRVAARMAKGQWKPFETRRAVRTETLQSEFNRF